MPAQNSALHKENRRLKEEVSKQDKLLRCTLSKLQKQRELKSEIESEVVEQIKHNCGLLERAKCNLQVSARFCSWSLVLMLASLKLELF